MRTVVVRLAIATLAMFGALVAQGVPANAQSERPVVRVIQIGGLLDTVQADFWQHAITQAENEKALALIVQLDSSRDVLSDTRFDALLRRVGYARIPIAAWVGPARVAGIAGRVVELYAAADVQGVAPGADAPPGDNEAPTLGDFVVSLDGRAGIDVPTKAVKVGKVTKREPLVEVRFSKPSLTARTIHGVTSPGPAYALLVFGLLLAILEFATAGIGLAAGTSAIMLALAALGLGALPTNPLGVVLIALACIGYAIDLQAGAPRAWTAIGTAALVAGTFSLFGDGMSVPYLWMLGVGGLSAAFVLAGLPSLIRARFSSPTIGREGFVGELGVAVGALGPEGLVEVRGGRWRARTNRATPIADGAAIRVVGIDGLVLDVEPEDGGAKDYRERSKSST